MHIFFLVCGPWELFFYSFFRTAPTLEFQIGASVQTQVGRRVFLFSKQSVLVPPIRNPCMELGSPCPPCFLQASFFPLFFFRGGHACALETPHDPNPIFLRFHPLQLALHARDGPRSNHLRSNISFSGSGRNTLPGETITFSAYRPIPEFLSEFRWRPFLPVTTRPGSSFTFPPRPRGGLGSFKGGFLSRFARTLFFLTYHGRAFFSQGDWPSLSPSWSTQPSHPLSFQVYLPLRTPLSPAGAPLHIRGKKKEGLFRVDALAGSRVSDIR